MHAIKPSFSFDMTLEDFVYPVLGIYAEYKIYHIVKEKEF